MLQLFHFVVIESVGVARRFCGMFGVCQWNHERQQFSFTDLVLCSFCLAVVIVGDVFNIPRFHIGAVVAEMFRTRFFGLSVADLC